MSEDRRRSPGQWAPWIDDPDPPEPPMTDEQMTAAARATRDLMSDPNWKAPVAPQPLAKTLEQIRGEMRQHWINVLMREFPTMSRERATELGTVVN